MSKVALIITLGNRDITFDRDAVETALGSETYEKMFYTGKGKYPQFQARQGGELLLKHFNALQNYLEIPIIQPALDYSFSKLSAKKVIDKIILIATNQPDSVGKFRNSDTLYLATLAKRLIPIKLKEIAKQKNKTGDKIPKVKSIDILLIENAISYYDEMYHFWETNLTKTPFDELEEYDTVFLSSQAGTPQIKTTLILKCINLYGHRLDLMSINEEKDLKLISAASLVFPKQYLRTLAYENVKAHLKQYNYLPLTTMELPTTVYKWAKYAHARLSFDFDLSHQIIQQLTPQETGGRNEYQVWKRDIMALKNGEGLLNELYWNARIKYSQGAYVDFLLRFFRIVEELAKNTVVKILGNFEYSYGTWRSKINDILIKPEYKDLAKYLNEKKIKGRRLNYQTPSIPTFKAILTFYQTQDPELHQFLQWAELLTELRNHSIGAHAFEPVSEVIINETLAEANTSISAIFQFLDTRLKTMEQNVFDRINAIVLNLMEDHKREIL